MPSMPRHRTGSHKNRWPSGTSGTSATLGNVKPGPGCGVVT
ncbi:MULTISPECIES: hypothetical protein [unclassified Acidovorax]|nr:MULTISPECIES: hypothetical protein [unclassified Acidovorax]